MVQWVRSRGEKGAPRKGYGECEEKISTYEKRGEHYSLERLRGKEVPEGCRRKKSKTEPHSKGEVGSSSVDADWHAFCQALFKGIEGEDWGEVHDAYKEMSRAVGSRIHRRPRKQTPFGK